MNPAGERRIAPALVLWFSVKKCIHQWFGRRFSTVAAAEDGIGTPFEKLFVVQPRLHPPALLRSKLMEALRLAHSLEQTNRRRRSPKEADDDSLPPYMLAQHKKRLHSATYFGGGTIDNIRTHLDVMDTEIGEIDAVFVNTSLTGIQQRSLEDAWEKPVLDRVGLIIEIFGSRARSKEAKLQVELAALDYKKSRLVRSKGGRQGFGAGGEQQVVSARGRASGGAGGFTSGAGETEIQLQRRRIAEKRSKLEKALAKARQTRSLHRSNREGIPLVAVVGYTNAGKSTLVTALTKRKLYADDRLFATLDTQLGSVYLPSGRKVLISDTVGFISDLPTQLVEAFHATLEEVLVADIVLHVMDSSAPNMDEQREAVLQVLTEIGVSQGALEEKTIEVLNKIDIVPGEEPDLPVPLLTDGGFDDDFSDNEDNGKKKIKFLGSGKGALVHAKDAQNVLTRTERSDEEEEEDNEDQEEKEEEEEEEAIWATQILKDGKVARVATSAKEGTGLENLLNAIDARLKHG